MRSQDITFEVLHIDMHQTYVGSHGVARTYVDPAVSYEMPGDVAE